ncbi:hypothetical protein ACFL9U_11295 [Thermodesulfobacteriota bacterium]
MEKFYSSDVAIFTGVTKLLLEHWITRGWVKPSLQAMSEPGTENIFSRVDLYHIAFIKKVRESGFSTELAVEKINIYPICQVAGQGSSTDTIGIAFSRVLVGGEYETQGAWIISSLLDKETGWDSLALIAQRLKEGADDFYIINFTKLKEQIDSMIDETRG